MAERQIMITIGADGKPAVAETHRTTSEMSQSWEKHINKLRADSVQQETQRILAAEKGAAARIAIAKNEAAAQETYLNKLRADSVRQETQRILAAEKTAMELKKIRASEVAAANLYAAQNFGAVSSRFQGSFDLLGIKSSLNIEAEKTRIIAAFQQIKNSGTASAAEISNAHRAMKEKLSGLNAPLNSASAGFASLSNAAVATYAVVGAIAKTAISQLHEAGMSAERMRNSFEAATGSMQNGAAAYSYTRAESQRLGLDLLSTSDAYLKLAASAKGTSLEGENTKAIFSSVAGAGRALGLSSEQMSGALLAISQMMSKGTVQAEELRGQLGERLPGAFNIAARAMGVTTAQLGKMLEDGKVVSEEFLPKFAAELQKTFPPGEKAMNGMTAETMRLKTAWYELKTTVMQGGGESMFTDSIRGMKGLVVEADSFYSRMVGAYGTLKLIAKNPMNPNLVESPKPSNYAPLNKYEQYLAAPDFSVVGPSGGASSILGSGENIFSPSRPIPSLSAADEKAIDKAIKEADKVVHASLEKGLTDQQKEYQQEIKSFLKDSWDNAALELAAEDFSSDVTKKLGLLTPQLAGSTKNPTVGLGVNTTLLSLAEQEAATKKLADAEAALLAIQTQRWQHQQNMYAITATAQVAALQFIGQDQAALQVRFAAERAATQANYEEQMRLAGENRDKQLQAENTFQESKYRIQTEYAQRQAELWWNGAQTYIGFSQQMTTMGLQMLMFDESQRSQIGKRMLATSIRFIAQSVQQYMFGEAKKHLITSFATSGQIAMQMTQHTASLTMLETEAVAWAAFLTALSLNPFGGQAAIPAAAAMTAVAGVTIPSAMAATLALGAAGAASEMGMAAAWTAGGVLVGALGEAGASAIEGGTSGSTTPAGYGAGSPASPVVTSPIAADNRSASPTYNIHIYGNVVDHDKFARELIPAITKATKDGVR